MTDSPQGTQRSRNPTLLNRSAARKFILDTFRSTRPHLGIVRVSGETLDNLEAWLRGKIRSEVHSHPSIGKTAKF